MVEPAAKYTSKKIKCGVLRTKNSTLNDRIKHTDEKCQMIANHVKSDRIGLKNIALRNSIAKITIKVSSKLHSASFAKALEPYKSDKRLSLESV